jgi:hypothetical protein
MLKIGAFVRSIFYIFIFAIMLKISVPIYGGVASVLLFYVFGIFFYSIFRIGWPDFGFLMILFFVIWMFDFLLGFFFLVPTKVGVEGFHVILLSSGFFHAVMMCPPLLLVGLWQRISHKVSRR